MKMRLAKNIFIELYLGLSLCGCNGVFTNLAAAPAASQVQQADTTKVSTARVVVKSRHKFAVPPQAVTASANTTPSSMPMTIIEGKLVQNSGNLWDRMAKDFQIPIPANNRAIQIQTEWFRQHQSYLNRTTERAAPIMYMVYEQAQLRHLPAEVVLLPIIESAYYPLAYSGAGAAGLWQLMPGTANKFGLKRNWWYDGRRDIFASTSAAMDYLSYLQNYFNGNMLLALAAYDAGEGTVQAAIRRNELAGEDTDFWSLKLPQETMIYVPRMLALANIIKNPLIYKIPLPAINDQPYLGKVDVGSQIKLADAADLAGISLAELKKLNPGYSRWTTVPNGGPSHLLLPLEKIAAFKEKLSTLPRVRKTSWGHYKIQAGDTLEEIAERYHTSVALLKRVNQPKKFTHILPPGKILLVPAVSQSVTPATVLNSKLVSKPAEDLSEQRSNAITQDADDEVETIKPAEIKQPVNKLANTIHIVKSGETLSYIALHYHVSLAQLKNWNKLDAQKAIKPGMKIIIVSKAKIITSSRHYTIRNGDSLSRISHKFNVSIIALKKLNPALKNVLKPGMIIKLF